MNKNLIWKMVLIIALTLLAAWVVYPPQERLKLGIDLAGGTSLIYEIDTTGLSPEERKGLAESMIPILLKRIDPTHMANIVMRPQEDNRIEIQLPMASPEARRKRQAFQEALQELEQDNLNLLHVKKILSLPLEERQAQLAALAKNNPERLAVLTSLAEAYDLQTAKKKERDEAWAQMEELLKPLEEQGLSVETIRSNAPIWYEQPKEQQMQAMRQFVKRLKPAELTQEELTDEQAALLETLQQYLSAYGRWAEAVNELTRPEDGANARWDKAVAALKQMNLDLDYLQDILELPANSARRQEALDALKKQFPDRQEKLAKVEKLYEEYRKVAGMLDDPEDLKRMLKGAGVLEFRILPTPNDGKTNMEEIQGYLEALRLKGPRQASDSKYVWIEIEDPANWPEGLGIVGTFGDKKYVLASNQPQECMLHSPDKKWKLRRAYPTRDDKGLRAIGFTFNQVGANLFYNLTQNNLNRPLCIVLDDRALSAPTIRSAISASGIIQGQFSPTEQMDLVNKLNAGSFRAKLSDVPISEKTIGPLLGSDNLKQGLRAGYIGFFAVTALMLFYYLIAGALADIALTLNLLFILAMMAAFNATFTLPGIAGLILTIGMSVDANVLIYERIREEQKRGSSLRAAVAAGYSRAFRTIFDSNLTTFAVAFILLMVASEEIKGFAIVLMLGIISSMFTALFVTRLIFDLLISRGILTRPLKMFAILQNARVDWMGKRPIFLIISGILVIGGLIVFFTRDESVNSKYDIEFTGGTSAQIDLKPGTAYTRKIVEDKFREYAESIGNRALAAAKVYSIGDSGLQYEITTTETNRARAEIVFQEAGQTVQSVQDAIQAACRKLDQTLPSLEVQQMDDVRFQITTRRLNLSVVQEVLQEAFGEKASIANLTVDEIVTDAIRAAFKDLLAVKENLKPEIVSITKVPAGTPELADFAGGIQIHVKLGVPATGKEIRDRLNDIKFRRDMKHLQSYPFQILQTDLLELSDDQTVSEFLYVSVHPEAAFRTLSEEEQNQFTSNEISRLTEALSLESSLARVTQIDPSIGAEAKVRALLAILLSLAAIVLYIGFRFGSVRYGMAAIIALVHDVCITLGLVTASTYVAGTPFGQALGILDFKINLEMIAAFLTIIGYSLNDTIVVFDRIRENRGKTSMLTPKLINDSINQTLSRTLMTSFTTFLVLVVMYIWGGTGMRGFSFAMSSGVVIGTYSSIAIASPILLLSKSSKDKS
ncbi:MAG TPA: protein translocase subunit SecD [Anaerohalosphaeraceae bacterium]|nr:protein translocase subunit SecD [Anaerohalosphaeraceae bacterium]